MTHPLDTSLRVAPQVPTLERARVHANLRAKMFGRPASPLRLGRFEIKTRVGGGAQGNVYRARDPELGRDVAIKVLRHAAEGPRREGRALAKLSHPNIVNVFAVDAQTLPQVGRVCYVVTEFVEGKPLPDWLANTPGRDARLAVLVGCGRGLLAAHRAGVVHGDFKPSNIMVEPGPVARVIDFGVASNATAAADARRVEGTRGYIAPERIAGRTGPENDQFALCVVAQEVLGTSAISARLRRALERGAAPRPQDRFGDIEPLIDHLVRERSPRRARWLLPGLAAVGLGTFVFTAREEASPPCASASAVARGVWTEQRQATFSEHRDAAALVKRGNEWISAWDDARIASCERGPAGARDVRCLEALLAEFDLRLDAIGRTQPGATVVESLARLPPPTACAEAKPTSADEEDEETLLRARVVGDREGPQALLSITDELASRIDRLDPAFAARVLLVRSDAARRLGRRRDAHAWLEAGVWKAEGAGDAVTATESASALAVWIIEDSGDLHLARTWLRRAEASAARTPSRTDDQRVQRLLAAWLREDGQFDDARAILDALGKDAEGLDGAQLLQDRCRLEEAAGNPQDAVRWCEDSIDATAEQLGRNHPKTLNRHQSLAAALEGAGRYAEARDVLEDAVRRLEATGQPVRIWVLNSLAIVLEQLGEFAEAEDAYAQALERAKHGPEGSPDALEVLELNLGSLALKQGRPDEAETRYRRSLIAMQSRLGADHPRTMSAHWGLAEALESQERFEEARTAIEDAIRVGERGGLGPALLVKPRVVRARILIGGNLDPEAGREAAARVLADIQTHAPENDDLIADARALLE